MPDDTSENSVVRRIAAIKARLSIPAFAAPMFLVSGPDLVIAACKAGIIGAFPTLNARPVSELETWMARISDAVTSADAPWAANLIVHRTYERFDADLALVARYRPEIVITALGSPARAVDAVHGYGGLVFADVSTVRYARKAVDAGADGLVLLGAGAGGHTGHVAGFSLVPAVREFFAGPIVLAGGIVTGQGIRAAEVLGADFAYLGTRFIAAAESLASEGYRQMLLDCTEEDLICTDHFTGIAANYMKPSIAAAGFDPDAMTGAATRDFSSQESRSAKKPWRDIWSAGHGVRAVKQVQSTAEIVAQLKAEYARAGGGT